MSVYLSEDDAESVSASGAAVAPDPRTSGGLRALDVALAGLLLLLLAVPLAVAAALGARRRQTVLGRGGVPFQRLSLDLGSTRAGRALSALGASHWPLLLNILRGQLAFVGPRPRRPADAVAEATLAVRPGLINPWFIRRRTAVDFGSEAQADADYLAARGLRHDLGLLLRGTLAAVLPPPAARLPGRVQVGDVAFDNVDMEEAIGRLGELLDGTQAQQVSFVNPACVNIAATHRGYRRLLARAALVLPDGIGIKIGSDLLGTPLKQNVNGTDLFPRLCEMLQARGASVFLLGGRPGVAEAVAAEIGRRWPGLRVAGVRDGYFSVAEEGSVAAQVKASAADVLLVARGVPAQDLFIDRHLPLLGVKLAMGVGGLFDFVSGRIARAPLWMREIGLEWVYRLLQEPGRMWRRYLIGNLSFLLRVALQRVGLRPPAADARPTPRPERRPGDASVRAVIFATQLAAADLPVPPDTPAALLPLGWQTVIEQIMDRLLHAAVTDVHLVASDRPEALRRLLGDGSRWGLRLHWHLMPDPTRPYGALRSVAMLGAQRLLLGHADGCPTVNAMLGLSNAPAWAMHVDRAGALGWSGWASLTPDQLSGLSPDLDFDQLVLAVGRRARPEVLWTEQSLALANSGDDQLRAASADHPALGESDIPASWVKTHWGAMSPTARVHPAARITGPVSIGPGCVVSAGAELGPGVVLSGHAVISGDTRLQRCVVLPDTYVGAGLELRDAVVNGARVRHVRLDVETALAPGDALLLDLAPAASPGHALLPRLLAGLAWLAVAPALACHAAWRRWTGRSPAWRKVAVVTGHGSASRSLRLQALHCPRTGRRGVGSRAWALMAGLADIAAGQRSWFGVRPRERGQWYALQPEWQRILSRAPVGLLHARAWTDDPAQREEVRAAADIFLAVQPPMKRAWTVMRGLIAPRHAGRT